MSTTLPGTGKIISSDPLNAATGLNGGVPATGEEVQRIKVSFGSAGFSRDVDAANPLPVVQAALTKSVQGSAGVTTQDLKDAGRVGLAFTCYQAAGVITAEALFAAASFSRSADGAAAATGQQFTVTAGKRFRVQAIIIEIKNTAAAAFTSKLVLRYLGAGGTILNSSPILGMWDLGSNNAVAANYVGPVVLPIPDGMELISSSTFGFTNLSNAVTALHTITMLGYEY